MSDARALVLVDHGSRRDEANAQLDRLAERLAGRLPGWLVRVAHLELTPPTLGDAIDDCVAAGAREIVIHPFFLAPGRHASEDVPRLAAEALVRHPDVRLRTTEILGLHESVIDAVLGRVLAADRPEIPTRDVRPITTEADRDRRSRQTE